MQALDGLLVQADLVWLGSASHGCQVLSWTNCEFQRRSWRRTDGVPGIGNRSPQDAILVQTSFLLHDFVLIELKALGATVLRTWDLRSVSLRDGIGSTRYKSCDMCAVKVLPCLQLALIDFLLDAGHISVGTHRLAILDLLVEPCLVGRYGAILVGSSLYLELAVGLAHALGFICIVPAPCVV